MPNQRVKRSRESVVVRCFTHDGSSSLIRAARLRWSLGDQFKRNHNHTRADDSADHETNKKPDGIDMEGAALSGLIGGIAGAAVAGVFTVLNLWLNRRSEERQQIRQLAVQAAIENWKVMSAFATKNDIELQPVDAYLIHASHLIAALNGTIKTPAQVRRHLRDTYAMTQAALQQIREYNQDKQRQSQ